MLILINGCNKVLCKSVYNKQKCFMARRTRTITIKTLEDRICL